MENDIGIISNVTYKELDFEEHTFNSSILATNVTVDYVVNKKLIRKKVVLRDECFYKLRDIVHISNDSILTKVDMNDLYITDLLKLLQIYNMYATILNDARIELNRILTAKVSLTNENINERINTIDMLKEKIQTYEYFLLNLEQVLNLKNKSKVKSMK